MTSYQPTAARIDSKEAGLEIGLYFFKYFIKSEYLHYGFFSNGLATDISNLAKAQSNYADLLMSNIPTDVKKILDVGCGSGKFAQQLLDKGYEVDCVSPGKLLTNYVKKLICDRGKLYNSKFENFKPEKQYDMVLFSESFQYIPIERSLGDSIKYLRPNGYIMICDFFKTDPECKSQLGGGHEWKEWEEKLQQYPLKTIIEKDITKETSPTIDLVNSMTMEVIQPVWRTVFALGENRFPLVMKLIRWKYKKKLEKMEKKHFSGLRCGENFRNYKKYMFYLLQK
jgi:SAM-dependent methyltransferase